jgi:serine/threonine protein phosphatase PrpC
MGCLLVKPVPVGPSESGAGTCSGQRIPYAFNAAQGRRPYMEDAVLIWSGKGEGCLGDCMVVGVFDGHGGSSVARFCESTFVEQLRSNLSEVGLAGASRESDPELLEGALHDTFFDLDDKIEGLPAVLVEPGAALMCCPAGDSYYKDIDGVGSTATVALVCANRILFGNCGDSRSVLVRAGAVAFETRDHCPNDPTETARVTQAGGFVEENRVDGVLGVARALGDHRFKGAEHLPPEQQAVTAKPDVTSVPRLHGKDQLIVLASDGLWTVMPSDMVAQFCVQRIVLEGMSPAQCAQQLLDACCNKLYSMDNVSVIIVDLRQEESQSQGPAQTQDEALREQSAGATSASAGAGPPASPQDKAQTPALHATAVQLSVPA